MKPLEQICNLGFELCGSWTRGDDGTLKLALDNVPDGRNVLYAFVVDETVAYVGKTVQGVAKRMRGYRRPHASQTTNVRVNSLILDQLETIPVHIYVWACDGLMTYGGFRLDLAAGLENSIVHNIKPEWNIRK